jgi:hypothetical protein
VAPFIDGAKVVRHRRKDKLVGTMVVCSWGPACCAFASFSTRGRGKDKVGKDSGASQSGGVQSSRRHR